jgi:hypothetical protein
MVAIMKAVGWMTNDTVKDTNDLAMEMYILVIFTKENAPEKECIPGQMEIPMMVSGKTGKKMVMVFGEVMKVTAT